MHNKSTIKKITLLLIMTSVLSVSCDSKDNINAASYLSSIVLHSFSYKNTISIYDINKPEKYPGVHFDNFNNNSISNIRDANNAVKRAKNECNNGLEYDSIDVYHDKDSSMWKVVFYNQNWTGDYCVYMNNQGITTLTVAGE